MIEIIKIIIDKLLYTLAWKRPIFPVADIMNGLTKYAGIVRDINNIKHDLK